MKQIPTRCQDCLLRIKSWRPLRPGTPERLLCDGIWLYSHEVPY